jgi:hypothetical protein
LLLFALVVQFHHSEYIWIGVLGVLVVKSAILVVWRLKATGDTSGMSGMVTFV